MVFPQIKVINETLPFTFYLLPFTLKMTDIRALKKEELQDFFLSHGEKAFRANQVYE